jgi:hypothetical protein
MAKKREVFYFKSPKKAISEEQEKQIQQILLQLAKIEFDWYQTNKENQTESQIGNRQNIGNN